jgi:uncharacterized membrane protein YkvA (DUF1232 family)
VKRLLRLARALKREVHALFLAARDRRTPWAAKLLAGFVAAYALSPVDLIPDAIPGLGLLDEVILLPPLIWLALRMIPPGVMADCRAAALAAEARPRSRLGLAIVVALWLLGALLLGAWLLG